MTRVVLALKPVTFKWNGDATTAFAGFIAQDVQKAIPLAVRENPDGYLELDTPAISAYLVGALQEQEGKIVALQNENDQLTARVEKLEARIGD